MKTLAIITLALLISCTRVTPYQDHAITNVRAVYMYDHLLSFDEINALPTVAENYGDMVIIQQYGDSVRIATFAGKFLEQIKTLPRDSVVSLVVY